MYPSEETPEQIAFEICSQRAIRNDDFDLLIRLIKWAKLLDDVKDIGIHVQIIPKFKENNKYSQTDVARCIQHIKDETEMHETYASDIAEKYDLDYWLVTYCLNKMEYEGLIHESSN